MRLQMLNYRVDRRNSDTWPGNISLTPDLRQDIVRLNTNKLYLTDLTT